MITTNDRAAVRARWLRATKDKRAFWRQTEINAFLADLEWILDEIDRLEDRRSRQNTPVPMDGSPIADTTSGRIGEAGA